MLNLKTVFLSIAVFSVAALSCSKDDKLPDPIQEMINQENFCRCLSTVDKYKWKSSIIYYIPIRLYCCTTPDVTSFYNEQGEPIHNPEWSSWQQFFEEAELIENIYTCEDAKNNP